jgi:hypothetical protein
MMTPEPEPRFPRFEDMVERSRFFLGVDLGQAQDPTALAVVQRLPAYAGHRLGLRYLERLALGTSYPRIVRHLKALMGRFPLAGRSSLVVDATGVGRPVLDYLHHEGLHPVGVVITGGTTVTWSGGCAHVPQRDLIGVTRLRLDQERLDIAKRMPLAATLEAELKGFQVRVTAAAHETFGREGAHDDLVYALSCACWLAQFATPVEVKAALGIGEWGVAARW